MDIYLIFFHCTKCTVENKKNAELYIVQIERCTPEITLHENLRILISSIRRFSTKKMA